MSGRWQVKCAGDSLKALMPFQPSLRRAKDTLFGHRREPAKDRYTIEQGLQMIEWLGGLSGLSVMEIGSGWKPIIPILFSLAGASVALTDLQALMRPGTFCAALEAIEENAAEIERRMRIPPDALRHVTRGCTNDEVEQRLRELRFRYLAPCDCSRMQLPSGSIDAIVSRAVLEHIPPAVIEAIFRECRRLLRPGGRMLHVVDYADHWAQHDKRISRVNFLQFADWQFRWTCVNPLNYQNRLRHSEYRAMLRATGFAVRAEQATVDPGGLEALRHMEVDARFRGFTAEDLATTDGILLAEPVEVAAESAG